MGAFHKALHFQNSRMQSSAQWKSPDVPCSSINYRNSLHTRFQTARLRATHSQGGQSTNTQPLRARTQRTELQSTKGEAPSFPSAAIHTTRTTTMYSMHSHCLFTDHWQAFHNNVQQTTRANATSHSSKLAEYHTTSTPPSGNVSSSKLTLSL